MLVFNISQGNKNANERWPRVSVGRDFAPWKPRASGKPGKSIICGYCSVSILNAIFHQLWHEHKFLYAKGKYISECCIYPRGCEGKCIWPKTANGWYLPCGLHAYKDQSEQSVQIKTGIINSHCVQQYEQLPSPTEYWPCSFYSLFCAIDTSISV